MAIFNMITGAAQASGLEYETGTYTPTADISKPTISFARSHTDKPAFALIVDSKNTYDSTTNTSMMWVYYDYDLLFKASTHIYSSSSVYEQGEIRYRYRSSNASSFSAGSSLIGSGGATDVSTSAIKPSCGSSRYWRASRTYKWIAIWV